MSIPTPIILDIETAPKRPELLHAAGWKPSRSFRPKGENESDAEYWLDWHNETAQLDPSRSWACAIGLFAPTLSQSIRISWAPTPEAETAALELAFKVLAGQAEFAAGITLDPASVILIGHNILKFDLPYLAARGLAHRISRTIPVRQVIDTKVEWENRYHVRGAASSSLDCIARHLGLPTKPGAGKDFWTYDRERQQEYLQHDLVICYQIASLLGVIPEAPPAAAEAERVMNDFVEADNLPEPL